MSLSFDLLHGGAAGLRSILAFLVVLGVLVFVHEMGHYLAARWRGVQVDAFSIGFGRELTGWTDRHGTRWKLAWLPLGGFVKLHGQERPEDVSEEVRAGWTPGRTFHGKSVGSRAIVVAAGPVANFVLAIVLFAGLFMIAGQPFATPVVSEVRDGSAAATAGLLPGDRITAIAGPGIDRPAVASFEDIQRIVTARPGAALSVTVQRDGAQRVLPITVGDQVSGDHHIGLLGITGANVELRRLDPASALAAGAEQTWSISAQTLGGLWQMVTGRRGTDDLGGPLRIAELSGKAAQLGLAPLVSLMAILSVSLGLINLFPIPILDGGHLLFYLLEAVRGRPVPPQAQEYGYRAGFALIAALFVFVTWNDLSHLGIFHWVAALFG
jgi:regulator of sigma E protease